MKCSGHVQNIVICNVCIGILGNLNLQGVEDDTIKGRMFISSRIHEKLQKKQQCEIETN